MDHDRSITDQIDDEKEIVEELRTKLISALRRQNRRLREENAELRSSLNTTTGAEVDR